MSKPLRVLIVEDSQADALLLLRDLRQAGYEPAYERVDRAETMNAALDRQTWDVVIADYVMPGFSGLAALDLLKARGLDLPFIVVSGQIGEDTAVAAMKAGAHDYIMKGNLARLVPAIEREVREAEVRRARRRAEEERDRLMAQLRTVNEQLVITTLRTKEQAEEMEAVISSLPEGVIVTDLQGNVRHSNPMALRMHGFASLEEARHLRDWARIFETWDLQGRPLPVEEWPVSRVLRGEPLASQEIRARRRDTGEELVARYVGTPARNREGEVILIVITCQEIAAEKLGQTG